MARFADIWAFVCSIPTDADEYFMNKRLVSSLARQIDGLMRWPTIEANLLFGKPLRTIRHLPDNTIVYRRGDDYKVVVWEDIHG